MDLNAVPLANPSLVLREEFDDWAILFDPDTGKAFGLNPVSVLIWKLADGKRTVGQIAGEIRTRCTGVPEVMEEQLQGFLEDLSRRGLVGWVV